MTFDAKSLLTAPLPPDMTVDNLIVALERLADMGFGQAPIKLPDGTMPNRIDLVAHGIEPAHFVLTRRIHANAV